MKELNSFTVERLEEFIRQPLENGLTRSEQMELARIALAAKRAEPNELADAVNEFLSVLDNYPEQLVPINRNSVPVKDLRKALSSTPQLNSPEIPEGWIKCSDQIPRQDDEYYLTHSNAGVDVTIFHDGRFQDEYATHWMPLPAAPEQPL
ncbi:DUF551 domain-containing protein [Yersinia sp. KBS0713]|uniref:DUF551 domain-containing protein n=1 Tax=Yersinia sp. KBS0713 TaxID=1179669 RepID=UPI00110EA05A|nr:DUF551 domain-containing protein [Yersinia sp. KBS0713]QDW34443.1 DUF551 domain-containing protein [Yersinia sp. KBS0713]